MVTTSSTFSRCITCSTPVIGVGVAGGVGNHLVGVASHLVFENNEVLGSGGEHADHSVAGLFHGLNDRQQRGHTHASAAAYHSAALLDVGGATQRADYVGKAIAGLERAYLACAHANGLYHQSDNALGHIGVCYGQRNAFAFFSAAHYHKVARFAGARYHGRLNVEAYHILREMFFMDYFKHRFKC